MLDIKQARPKTRQKAVYVTEDNVKEFLEYAYPGDYNLDTLVIDRSEHPYLYASIDYLDTSIFDNSYTSSSHFILNKWYVYDDHDWYDDWYFEDKYEIESSTITEVK